MRVHPCSCFGLVLSGLVACLCTSGQSSRAQEKAAVSPEHARRMREGLALFKEHVRPALSRYCLDCHGGQETKGHFDLSDARALDRQRPCRGRQSVGEPALPCHRPRRRAAHAAEGPKLPDATIAESRRWIDLGAPYDRPLVDRRADGAGPPRGADCLNETSGRSGRWPAVTPPSVRDAAWARTPIDRFILAALERRGLTPNPPADRRTLIRRVSFDLTGLPPSPEEVDAFVADPAPDAYERLVDRLLARPHFGERWARHWMDVARFAESHGYEQDYDRPFAYHYRDFLIRAFNDDMPYDQFVRWQLAGDELAPDDPLAMAATGFLGAGRFPTQLTEAEFESARYNELDDMVATTGAAFLGLSVGCARCHDHKYDPIPSDDYYRLAAVFTTTIRSEIDVPCGPGAKPVKVQVTAEGFPHTKHHADERGFPHFYPKTYVLRAATWLRSRARPCRASLRVLTRRRQGRARWKVEPPRRAGPARSFRRAALAALAHRHRGRGRAAGRAGDRQPALAAPLRPGDRRHAQRLRRAGRAARRTPSCSTGWPPTSIENGWRLKPIHRLIVTSAVYMQDSRFDEARAADRPRERLLLATHPAAARGRADPRRDAGGGRPARPADVRPGLARPRDAAAERLFLHQAEPAHPDDDALRLARAPGEHRPAERPRRPRPRPSCS